ncbi:DoxX family protein [Streptomyces palmae]|uniref:DoxX family protein n=1 Tax=Streptomyces palmae TaxID=1701085 RepID=A0A4Z0GMJ8_9ACTN|nr:DoxX family protein [Streptomyces palmae]TGA97759.1 DoxX family protein [Streptomyces palmae]
MPVVLWVAQALLAVLFTAAGGMKLVMSPDAMVPLMPWVVDFRPETIKVIGALEVLGAVGLILPRATNIAPVLTPVAAAGLACVMAGGAVVHATRGEYPHIIGNVIVFAVALLTAWGALRSLSCR